MLQNNGKNKLEMDLFEKNLQCELMRLKQSVAKKQICLVSALSDSISNADFRVSFKKRSSQFAIRCIKHLFGISVFNWMIKKTKSLILSYKKYKITRLMRGAE